MNLAQHVMRLAEIHKRIDREIDQMLHGQPPEILLAAKVYRKACHVIEDARADNYDATEFTKIMAEQIGNIVTEIVASVSPDVSNAAQMAQAMYLVSAQRTATMLEEVFDRRRKANAPTPPETAH